MTLTKSLSPWLRFKTSPQVAQPGSSHSFPGSKCLPRKRLSWIRGAALASGTTTASVSVASEGQIQAPCSFWLLSFVSPGSEGLFLGCSRIALAISTCLMVKTPVGKYHCCIKLVQGYRHCSPLPGHWVSPGTCLEKEVNTLPYEKAWGCSLDCQELKGSHCQCQSEDAWSLGGSLYI